MLYLPEIEIKSFIDSTFNNNGNFQFYLNQLDIDTNTYQQVLNFNFNNTSSILLNFPFVYAEPNAVYIVINLEENHLVDQTIGNKISDGTYVVFNPITITPPVVNGITVTINSIIDNNHIVVNPSYKFNYSYDQVNNVSYLTFNDPLLTSTTSVSITYNPIYYTSSQYAAIYRYGYSVYIGSQNELVSIIYSYVMKELFYTQILNYLNSIGAYNIEYSFEPFLPDREEEPINIYMRKARLAFNIMEEFDLPPGVDAYVVDNPMLDNTTFVTSLTSSININS